LFALGRQPLPQQRGSRNVWHVRHGRLGAE
jgi:hypothetical protein